MTIPIERTNALIVSRDFLMSLLNPKETPKVPRHIRKQAYWCLKHYPNDYEIIKLAKMDKKKEILE